MKNRIEEMLLYLVNFQVVPSPSRESFGIV